MNREVPTVQTRGKTITIRRAGQEYPLVTTAGTDTKHAAGNVRGAIADGFHAGQREADARWHAAIDAHIERTADASNNKARQVRALADKLEAGESVRAEYIQASAEMHAIDAAITALVKLRDERKR